MQAIHLPQTLQHSIYAYRLIGLHTLSITTPLTSTLHLCHAPLLICTSYVLPVLFQPIPGLHTIYSSLRFLWLPKLLTSPLSSVLHFEFSVSYYFKLSVLRHILIILCQTSTSSRSVYSVLAFRLSSNHSLLFKELFVRLVNCLLLRIINHLEKRIQVAPEFHPARPYNPSTFHFEVTLLRAREQSSYHSSHNTAFCMYLNCLWCVVDAALGIYTLSLPNMPWACFISCKSSHILLLTW